MQTDAEQTNALNWLYAETPPVGVLLIRPGDSPAPDARALLENNPRLNCQVSTVPDIAAALAQENSDWQLVLLDCAGNGNSAREISHLRAATKLPVIAINGADDPASIRRAAEAGAQDYISREALNAELLARSIHYALKFQEMATYSREYQQLQENFISHISHDLRTPLNSIMGFTQLLLEGDIKDQATQLEFLNIVKDQSLLLSRLIDNLLDVSVISPEMFRTEKSPCQPAEFIHQALEDTAATAAEKEVRLRGEVPDTLPEINADATRLARAVGSLLSNAVKFSDGGSEVRLRAQADQRQITISVADHGIGIAKESLPYLFDRFYAAGDKDHQAGTGMGLYLTRAIVEAHEGNIWAESKPGHGSTFYITLPLTSK